ncbi:MAG: nitroreductase family protein [Proteobacteria bacterium]|nr:nitroreductase family protein [Pseudomonadota bacterium]
MGLLKIDKSKCKQDGLCAKDCMTAIIRIPEGGGFPYIPDNMESMCRVCGHCVAVCPHGALSHELVPLEKSPAIKDELKINQDQAVQFLRTRRSIRFYHDKGVEKEKIQKLIETARYAPTASNSQLVEWIVISDKSKIHTLAAKTTEWLRQLLKDDPAIAKASPYLYQVIAAWDGGYDPILRKAPTVLVASAPKEALGGATDVVLALSYLELLAPVMELGTCWAGLLNGALTALPSLKEYIGLPKKHPHHFPLMIGYPKAKYYRLPERKQPRITYI